MAFSRLPFDYSVTAMLRSPLRSTLAILTCAIACSLGIAALSFSATLAPRAASPADSRVAVLLSLASEGDPLRSEIDLGVVAEIGSGVAGIEGRDQRPQISPELLLGIDVRVDASADARPAIVRGITPVAAALHPEVRLGSGRSPQQHEAMVGALAWRRLGVPPERLAIGNRLTLSGTEWTIVGQFTASGSSLESELWLPLDSLLTATRRSSVSVAYVALESRAAFGNLDLFMKTRRDLALTAMLRDAYDARVASFVTPIARLGLAMATLIVLAAILSSATTLGAIVRERRIEIATLRAIGFGRGDIASAVLIESVLYAAIGAVLGSLLMRVLLPHVSVVIGMGAVRMHVPTRAITLSLVGTLFIAPFGALPALLASWRTPLATALRTS